MSRTNQQWSDDADAWYFNLESMAKRIEENEQGHRHARRRQYLIFGFVFFASMLLAYRSELSTDRIDYNTKRITDQQIKSCESGLVILTNFNAFLDAQIAIERTNRFIDEVLRAERIAAYEKARIEPLPACGPTGRVTP